MIKENINKAYNFSKKRHEGQFRKFSGLPYFSHPKYVARVVERLTCNESLIIAAFLHDIVEDTETTIDEVNKMFGTSVASLVMELTNNKEDRGKQTKKVYLKRKMLKMSDEALIIKLVDRMHNLIFLEKDCNDTEQVSFTKYYVEDTEFILNNFERRLNDIHKSLILRIRGILGCLRIQYYLKEKEK